MNAPPLDYDAIVIGTGFGGAVSAARLVQAGLCVLVLERGMRYEGNAFPALPRNGQVLPDTARYTWSAREGRVGLWDVRDLGDTHAAQAAGYGGGSLIYANVQLRAPQDALASWPKSPEHPYTREALDPYYDLAAFMLDARTIAQAPGRLFPLHKTSALRAAAKQIGYGSRTLYPPLAVHFGEAGENRFGKHQEPCNGCGECNTGCRFGAKSSLDKNYLALVERARNGKTTRAVVRTLAEAYAINQLDPAHPERGYRVDFFDHHFIDQGLPTPKDARDPKATAAGDDAASPDRAHATARYVFVCAGALGSSELLFKSRELAEDARKRPADGKPTGLPSMTTRALGHNYFGNSDALGIVIGSRHKQEPNVGPVITTAVVHRGKGGERAPWMMVQDGGYGAPVHAMVRAFFESPAWLGRNRFYEYAPVADPSAHGEALPSVLRAAERFPLLRRNASLAEGAYNVERARELERMIPEQLTRAGELLTARAERWFAQDVEKTIDELQHRIVRGAARHSASFGGRLRKPFLPLYWLFRALYGTVGAVFRFFTVLGARSTLAIERQAGMPAPDLPALGAITASVMKDRYDLHDQRALFMRVLRTLSVHAPSDRDAHMAHTAVLLTMGRDQQRHTLRLERGTLQAKLEIRGERRLYSYQERFMRAIASALGGELRLNPAWSQAHTPVTVHGQGGCGMHPDPQRGVTDVYGQVHGCAGLYVMDAALFPSPVGVNPSATILAVAERNIERFIRVQLGRSDFVAKERGELEAYVKTPEGAAWRRSIAEQQGVIDDDAVSDELPVASVGIRFTERMFGFVSSELNEDRAGGQLRGRRSSEQRYGAYEACYLAGRRAGDGAQLTLQVDVEDLPAFLADDNHAAKLRGTLELSGPYAEQLFGAHAIAPLHGEGTITILGRARKDDERLFRYQWRGTLPDGRALHLDGHKRVRDEPGQDEWKDTTALFFWLHTGSPTDDPHPALATDLVHGIARVSLNEFLFEQMRTMEVTGVRPAPDGPHHGPPDPATVAWAMASFGAFFFGNLSQVYLREADLARRVLKRSLSLGGDDS